jgi:hypothetical protein
MKDAKIEVVVEAGAEDGSLRLFRQATRKGGFEYFTELDANGFEDIPGLHEKSGRVTTLEEGFALLDTAPGCEWHRLSPFNVHPDHAAAVLAAVEARLSREDPSESNEYVLKRWRRRCESSDDAAR